MSPHKTLNLSIMTFPRGQTASMNPSDFRQREQQCLVSETMLIQVAKLGWAVPRPRFGNSQGDKSTCALC